MVKKVVKKSAGSEVVSPEVVGNAPLTNEFPEKEATSSAWEEGNLYTVRLDNKKLEGRTLAQVTALVVGSDGIVKKIVIELE